MKAYCLVGLLLCAATPALGYVRTRTTKGDVPLWWPIRCITIAPDIRGDTSGDLSADDIEATMRRVVTNWNKRIAPCSYMSANVLPAMQQLAFVSDGRPAVTFYASDWDDSKDAIAITSAFHVDKPDSAADGMITDADIKMNAVNFTLTTDPQNAAIRKGTTDVFDFESVLTHEFGHVLGLAHTCWDPKKVPIQPTDGDGNPVPNCDDVPLPAKVTNALMYISSVPRTTNLRTVGDDEVAGICDTYPKDSTPTACYGFIDNTGCAMGRRDHVNAYGAAAAFVALVMSLLLRRHRRLSGI